MTLLNKEHAQELERQVDEFLRLELALLFVMQKMALIDKDFAGSYLKCSPAFIQSLSSLDVSELMAIRESSDSRCPLLRICDSERDAIRLLNDCKRKLPFPLF